MQCGRAITQQGQTLSCTHKSPRYLWVQLLQRDEGQISLERLFETALSAERAWPNALELDLVNATCSRELQLPYKDERERLTIMELHGRAQEVINKVNDSSMELLRKHFEQPNQPPPTLAELAAQPDAETADGTAVLATKERVCAANGIAFDVAAMWIRDGGPR